jgi:colanic acid/amylovoran biosynthesis protein
LALRKVNVVVLREKSSERAVSLLAPNIARFLTTDVAFLSPGCSTEQVQSLEAQWLQDARRPIVGISVRFYSFPGESDAKGKTERYVECMASCAQHLVTAHGATVYFVPQVLLDQLSDVVMARAVCSRIADKSFIRILEADLSPTELRGLYSCFDAFVGVRMHANIFALSECVPTLAIAYEPKTAGIMSLLGLSDYVLNIRQLEIGSLLDRVDLLMANRASLRRQLISAVVDARTIAARTADIIREQMQLRGVVTNAGSLK